MIQPGNLSFQSSFEVDAENIPRYWHSSSVLYGGVIGAIGCHLITSLRTASRYGRSLRLRRGSSEWEALVRIFGSGTYSESVGRRSLPITLSSSACASFCTSGCNTMARTKTPIAAVDVSTAPLSKVRDMSWVIEGCEIHSTYKGRSTFAELYPRWLRVGGFPAFQKQKMALRHLSTVQKSRVHQMSHLTKNSHTSSDLTC